MKSEPRHLVDYRRLAKRNLASLLRYKFLYEYGYDKGAVVAAAIVDDICATVRAYYRRAGDLEPGQLIYNAAAKNERGGRGKTMAKTRLVPVRLTLIADEDLDAIRQHLPFTTRRAAFGVSPTRPPGRERPSQKRIWRCSWATAPMVW